MKVKFELWLQDERGVLTKPRDRNDHVGFVLRPRTVRGWARIERKRILLIRTDSVAPIPQDVMWNYVNRYPEHAIGELHEPLRHY